MAAVPPLAPTANGQPRNPLPGSAGTPRAARTTRRPDKSPRIRAGVWVGVCVAAVVLVALIVFMLQNTESVLVSFLGMQGTVPLAVALLIAGAGVGVIALAVGSVRIGRLRRRLRRVG